MNKFVIALLMLIVPAVVAAAGPPMAPTLPVVQLTSITGTAVSADQFGVEKKMLLILVTKGNPAGERLIGFLESVPELSADRVAIIVGNGDSAVVATIAQRHQTLKVEWYPDPDEQITKGLKLQATPVILGVRSGSVAWRVVGLRDEEEMGKTLRGWISR